MTITQLNQALSIMIRAASEGTMTIGAICAKWNAIAHENFAVDMNMKMPTPTRRAKLIEMLKTRQFRVNYADDRCEEGCDVREWSGESIERDHAEALKVNDLSNMFKNYWSVGVFARLAWFDADYDKALRMNVEHDALHEGELVLTPEEDAWQTKARGNEFMTGRPLKTYEEWLNS